jgi:collagenase-like PrtC family protease
MPSGRSPLTSRSGATDWSGQQRLEADLSALREMGVRLDLLLNANCYGPKAISRQLENQVRSIIEHLGELVGGPDAVTTTSPAIAQLLKKHYPPLHVRASVNMRLGTTMAMSQVAELFDGYYVQRDFNRDLRRIAELKAWADAAGKKLFMLANSGCLRFCAGQTFHDNLVAHEAEVSEMHNIEGYTPYVCWNLLKDRRNWPVILQGTWVRPEDLHNYEGLFEVVKLATRMHQRPQAVIRAYTQGRWRGNLLDLLEPGYSPALAPYVIDNSRFPADWFQRSSNCAANCHACDYCRGVLEQVLVNLQA